MSEPQTFLDGRVTLYSGDCLDVLASLPENSVDSVVCDPPYHLTSIVKRFGGTNAAPAKHGTDGLYARASKGFMQKTWDGGDIAFRVELWAEVWRVLKPGGYLAAFSATRTYHRMAVAIEDAGFEIRDQLAWAYGSGFPKSHDVSKAIDKAAGAERASIGKERNFGKSKLADGKTAFGDYAGEWDITEPATAAAREWQGWGTALKPAWEPICLARKPLIGTVAENVLAYGTGALNIDGCRVGTDENLNGGAYCDGNKRAEDASSYVTGTKAGEFVQPSGRWPANLIHDGSDEVVACFPDTGPAKAGLRGNQHSGRHGGLADIGGNIKDGTNTLRGIDDNGGSAARFFYSAKADSEDRIASKHPTVKPLDLMQYLCRLVTPPRGTVLDPFAGTGTTGEAAWREGFNAILIEREPEYQADIARRMDLATKPSKRAAVVAGKGKLQGAEGLPLFGGEAA